MTLHRIGQAREDLYLELVDLLDEGRVSAYPADQDVGVQAWIDVHRLRPVGNGLVVDLPVHVTYDGTESAQIAGIEDIVSRLWDVCERKKGVEPLESFPGPDRIIGSSSRHSQIVNVRTYVAARTLCPPDAPDASPIPPDQAQE